MLTPSALQWSLRDPTQPGGRSESQAYLTPQTTITWKEPQQVTWNYTSFNWNNWSSFYCNLLISTSSCLERHTVQTENSRIDKKQEINHNRQTDTLKFLTTISVLPGSLLMIDSSHFRSSEGDLHFLWISITGRSSCTHRPLTALSHVTLYRTVMTGRLCSAAEYRGRCRNHRLKPL